MIGNVSVPMVCKYGPIHISGNPGYRLPDEYGRMPAQQPGQPDQPGYGQPGKPGFWSQGQPGYGKPDDIGRAPNQPGYGQFGPSSEQMQRRGKYFKQYELLYFSFL